MAVTDRLLARAEPWLRETLVEGLRALLPLPLLGLAWWFVRLPLDTAATTGMIIYALLNLGLLLALRSVDHTTHKHGFTAMLLVSVLSDAVLAIFLLRYAGPLTLSIFPIYAVMVLKAIHYREVALWTMFVPALLGPLDLAALYLIERDYPLSTEHGIAFVGLVIGTFGFVSLLLVIAERRLWKANQISANLEQARIIHLARVAELEASSNHLRVRNRRQQALEESLRAITGSLSLDAVLSQILDSLIQMLGAPRVSAAALTRAHGDHFTHHTLSTNHQFSDQTDWAERMAQQVTASRTPLIISDPYHETNWQVLKQAGITSALSVPLIDLNGKVLGALSVVSMGNDGNLFFTDTDARHLTSFSIQASVAIHNAELHTELARQGRLLEAVLRDIGDGLMVVNEQGAMVLANPVAYQALQHSDSHSGQLREQLDRLNHALREDGRMMISHELKVGEDEHQRHYQIYASIVHVDPEQPSLVAFALHDVTEQKLHEQRQVEFISMVSHELRNPLNTLNGFLKIVYQGQVGPLNETQNEFLGLAADQADALKGRITELLEFNRLEAGRLRIQPQWSNLGQLIMALGTRFQVQAQQFELQVSAELPAQPIPELLMDDQRVDQVLTNLIENAMKATPPGGKVMISAEVLDHEVLVHVADTGIGIPLDQQEKIFSRFYRLEHKSSKHGAHLGLGLAICQQIIEGHNGRIWVESEEGRGSRFSIALPLVHKEQTIGEAVL